MLYCADWQLFPTFSHLFSCIYHWLCFSGFIFNYSVGFLFCFLHIVDFLLHFCWFSCRFQHSQCFHRKFRLSSRPCFSRVFKKSISDYVSCLDLIFDPAFNYCFLLPVKQGYMAQLTQKHNVTRASVGKTYRFTLIRLNMK